MAQPDTATATAELEPIVKIEDAGPARKVLTIEVPAAAIAAKLEDNFRSLQNEAAIPGFRKGHAPKKLLERRFGSDIRKEVCSQLVGESYTAAVEKNELRVLGEPDIKDAANLKLPESGPLSVTIEIEVVPDVTLPELKGIAVQKPVFVVTDEQVDAEIARFGEMYGQPKPVERTSHNDYITADITIKGEDGSVLVEQKAQQMVVPGEQRKFKGVVSGIVIEDLGNLLNDKQPGDVVTVTAAGPEGHETEKLRGQKLAIDISIQRIERLEPMTAAQLTEAMGLENEAALRGRVKERLDQQAANQQRSAMAGQVVKHLLASVELTLPEKLSARQAEGILRRRAMEMMYQGSKPADIEQNLADLRASSQETAQRELKALFILDAVARKLEVEVSEAEVNGRVAELAAQRGVRPERVREEMSKGGQLEQLYVQIREEKAVLKVLEDAKVSDIGIEEWNKSQGIEGEEAAPKKKSSGGKKKSKE
jgi:trigger factor